MITSVFSTFLELLLKAEEEVRERLGRVGGAVEADGGMLDRRRCLCRFRCDLLLLTPFGYAEWSASQCCCSYMGDEAS